jgi:hypothetical protein
VPEYLSNADLTAEIVECQKTMIVSDRLARMLVLRRYLGDQLHDAIGASADLQRRASIERADPATEEGAPQGAGASGTRWCVGCGQRQLAG